MSSIFSALLGAKPNVFTNEVTGAACWTAAKIKSVDIITDSANADVPLSTENVNESEVVIALAVADVQTSKIITPVKVRAELLISDISVIENIEALFNDPTVTISITSRSVISNSMAISSVEIEQSEEMLSASTVVITFEQVVNDANAPGAYNPQQAGDSNNYGLNVASPASVGTSLGALTSPGSLLGGSAPDAATALWQRVSSNIGL